jgi:hypothetical protein
MIFLLLIVPLIGVFLLLLEPSFSPSAQHHAKYNAIAYAAGTVPAGSVDPSVIISRDASESKERIKRIALLVSLINFFISIILWFQFDPNSANYQFVSDFGSIISYSDSLNFCHFHVGIDGISLYFVLLTTFITPICILSN